jgi:hypothetical protein
MFWDRRFWTLEVIGKGSFAAPTILKLHLLTFYLQITSMLKNVESTVTANNIFENGN